MKRIPTVLKSCLRALILFAIYAALVGKAHAYSYMSSNTLAGAGANAQAISVSGFSSGAFFSVQMGVAFSSWITGVGVIAGGVYDCAEGNTDRATEICLGDPGKTDLGSILKITQGFANQQKIDPLSNLARQKVFIFSGKNDTVVAPQSGQVVHDFYTSFGASVVFKNDLPAAHSMPTLFQGNPCDSQEQPWLINCGYDAAGAILNTIYGPLSSPVNMVNKNLHDFNQMEFGSVAALMGNVGAIYIPTACQAANSNCRLHIAFHGCLQSPEIVGDSYVKNAGYNQWAEANQIIVLYPAATLSEGNPGSCWDWFAYSGADYAVAQGPQLQVIKAMVGRLTSPAKPH